MSFGTRHPALGTVLIALVIGIDQYTKYLVRAMRPSLRVGPLTLLYTQNRGAFLSLGENLPADIRALIFNVAVGIGLALLAVYLVRKPEIPLALVFAGGVGNLIDRLRFHGEVTDFLYLEAGPLHTGVFNVADMVITAGAIWLILTWFTDRNDDVARQPLESHEQQHSDHG